ncbi:hypothetical protein [Chitinophaga rhizosphaerae]|uniref:hypothetical protein n=1 Tax=Chitinophaga rhizosphaerae TaxID=1864947 RepID=UPI000F80DF73
MSEHDHARNPGPRRQRDGRGRRRERVARPNHYNPFRAALISHMSVIIMVMVPVVTYVFVFLVMTTAPAAAIVIVTIVVMPAIISFVTGISVVPSMLCLCGISCSKEERQED